MAMLALQRASSARGPRGEGHACNSQRTCSNRWQGVTCPDKHWLDQLCRPDHLPQDHLDVPHALMYRHTQLCRGGAQSFCSFVALVAQVFFWLKDLRARKRERERERVYIYRYVCIYIYIYIYISIYGEREREI